MRKLVTLVLVAGLSGCVVVDDGPDHYVAPPAPLPPRPLEPAVRHLDCGFLERWNCWDQAVAEAEACAPQTWSYYGGVLDDDGYSCFYEDGSAVFFEEPVTVPLAHSHRWSFSMEDPAGRTCGWFTETNTSASLGTASGVVDVVVDSAGISVTCQDGTQYFNRDPQALAYCASAHRMPGLWTESAGTTTAFGLYGGDEPMLFSCTW